MAVALDSVSMPYRQLGDATEMRDVVDGLHFSSYLSVAGVTMAVPIPIMGVEAAAAAEAAAGYMGASSGGNDMRMANGRNDMPSMASAGKGSKSTLQGVLGIGQQQQQQQGGETKAPSGSTLSIVSPDLMSALSPMYGAGRPRGYMRSKGRLGERIAGLRINEQGVGDGSSDDEEDLGKNHLFLPFAVVCLPVLTKKI